MIVRQDVHMYGSRAGDYAMLIDVAGGAVTNSRNGLYVAGRNDQGANRPGVATVTLHSGAFEQGGAMVLGVAREGRFVVHGGSLTASSDCYVGGGCLYTSYPAPVSPAVVTGLLHVTGGTVTLTNAPSSGSAYITSLSNLSYLFTENGHPLQEGRRVVLTDADPELIALGWETNRVYFVSEVRTLSLFGLAETFGGTAKYGVASKRMSYATFPSQLHIGNWTTFKDGTLLAPGQLKLEGGTVTLDELIATNGAASAIAFTGGTLSVKNSTVAGGAPLAVGGGMTPAVLNLEGGLHTFADGLTLASNATLSVSGSAAGVAAVAGDLTLGSSSTFNVDLTAAGGDRLSVTGSVTLAEGALSVAASGDAPTGSTAFVILENDGSDAVSGRFGNRCVSVAWDDGIRDYLILCAGGDGNDVELWPVPPGTLIQIR